MPKHRLDMSVDYSFDALSDHPGPHPDTVFDADWLSLRNAADSAARSESLNARLAAWLAQRATDSGRPLQLSDLGSGSGANPRYLAPRLPGPQHWRLLDHDAGLLERARQHCLDLRDRDGQPITVNTLLIDLRDLHTAPLADTDLITASALLDLVDANWLEDFADLCARIGCVVLITLSVDGNWHIDTDPGESSAIAPGSDVDDEFVRTAFNEHQRGDKGGTRALGPDAATRLAELLRTRGFDVELAPSPWRLSSAIPAQAALARALIDGWRDAASAQCPEARTRIAAWHQRRQAALGHTSIEQAGLKQAGMGEAEKGETGMEDATRGWAHLEITLGHLDLLALPRRSTTPLVSASAPKPTPSPSTR